MFIDLRLKRLASLPPVPPSSENRSGRCGGVWQLRRHMCLWHAARTTAELCLDRGSTISSTMVAHLPKPGRRARRQPGG